MPELIGQYEADQSGVTRAFDLPASAKSLDRLQRLLSAWRTKLRGLDFPKLDPAGRLDYVLLANELDRSLAHASRDRRRLANGAAPAVSPDDPHPGIRAARADR